MSVNRRRQVIEVRHSKLSLARQCELVGIARSSYYYRPKKESEFNLELMRLIDEQYLRTPWYGSRQMRRYLRRQGLRVNRKRIRRLMQKMGLVAVAPAPNTSRRHPQHKIYPYLLRGLQIRRPGQVWCADVTYIPMAHGFLYLVAIMDWYSRRVLSWRLSNTMEADFCVEALQEALIVAEPGDVPGPVHAFLAASGQGINFHRGTWHGVLTPLHEPGLFAVVDRIGDTANLEEHWLETPVIIGGPRF